MDVITVLLRFLVTLLAVGVAVGFATWATFLLRRALFRDLVALVLTVVFIVVPLVLSTILEAIFLEVIFPRQSNYWTWAVILLVFITALEYFAFASIAHGSVTAIED